MSTAIKSLLTAKEFIDYTADDFNNCSQYQKRYKILDGHRFFTENDIGRY